MASNTRKIMTTGSIPINHTNGSPEATTPTTFNASRTLLTDCEIRKPSSGIPWPGCGSDTTFTIASSSRNRRRRRSPGRVEANSDGRGVDPRLLTCDRQYRSAASKGPYSMVDQCRQNLACLRRGSVSTGARREKGKKGPTPLTLPFLRLLGFFVSRMGGWREGNTPHPPMLCAVSSPYQAQKWRTLVKRRLLSLKAQQKRCAPRDRNRGLP
jgi:hypothetical protein